MKTATLHSPKNRPHHASTRPVPELLHELVFRLHATRAVATRPESDWRPRKSR